MYDFVEAIQSLKFSGEKFYCLCRFSKKNAQVATHIHNPIILVAFNLCRIVQQIRQVASALCSAERWKRGASQMAAAMFSRWFHCHIWFYQSSYLFVLSIWFTWTRGEGELLIGTSQFTQASKRPETDNWNQRGCEQLIHSFPLYHTYFLLWWNQHRHHPPLTSDALAYQFGGLEFNSWNKPLEGSKMQ